jgi:RNA polymerase sigma-70 factor (ECF subfamily)
MSSIALNANVTTWSKQPRTTSRKARFDALVATHLDDLYRYSYWLTGNRTIAEDLVQETLLRAWRAIDKLEEPAAAKGWLLTILRRENARRFERQTTPEADVPVEAVADSHRHFDTSTEAFALRRALEQLPEDYREPLLLQVIYGYSQKEIAERLGISSAGVGTRLFRARQKMRELLEGTA